MIMHYGLIPNDTLATPRCDCCGDFGRSGTPSNSRAVAIPILFFRQSRALMFASTLETSSRRRLVEATLGGDGTSAAPVLYYSTVAPSRRISLRRCYDDIMPRFRGRRSGNPTISDPGRYDDPAIHDDDDDGDPRQ